MKNRIFTLIVSALSFCTSHIYAQAGSLDSTFGKYGKVTTSYKYVTSEDNVALQQNGKIVVSGIYLNSQTQFNVAMLRYNTDGTLDNAFGINGIAEKRFQQGILAIGSTCPFIMLSDEKLIVAACPFNNEGLSDLALTKFTTYGIIDSSFGENGTVITSKQGYSFKVRSMALQNDGKIIAGGFVEHAGGSRFLIVRYNADGTLDPTFNGDGFFVSSVIHDFLSFDDIAIQPDGKIVALGSLFSNESLELFRLTTQGNPDLSFAREGFISMTIAQGYTEGNAIALQADGKILVTGKTMTDHLRDILLIRFESNGLPDKTFGNNGVRTINYPGHDFNAGNDIKVQQDGKIIIAGETAPEYSSHFEDFLIVRCNNDGSVDKTFGINGFSITDFGTEYDAAYGLALQPDGKIIATGNTSFSTCLARYKNDNFSSLELLSKSADDIFNNHRGISIYPNPVKSTMNIKGLDANSQSILTITNASGKMVSRAIVSGNNYSMNVNHLSAGLYVLSVYSKNKTVSLKFLKE